MYAAKISVECEHLASDQLAPYVLDFDWGYHPAWDEAGHLHETIGFTMLNGSIRHTLYCDMDNGPYPNATVR